MNMELIRAEGLKLKRLCRLIPFLQGIILISMTALEWYLYFRQGPGSLCGFCRHVYVYLVCFFIGHYDSCQHNGRYGARNEGLEAAAGHADPQRIDLSDEIAVDFHFAAVHCSDYGRWHVYHLVFIYERTAAVENPDLTAAFRLLVFPADDGDPAVVFHRVFQPGVAAGYRNIRFHFQPVFTRSRSFIIHLLPWSYPALSSPLIPGHVQWIWISLGVGLSLSVLGAFMFARREFE